MVSLFFFPFHGPRHNHQLSLYRIPLIHWRPQTGVHAYRIILEGSGGRALLEQSARDSSTPLCPFVMFSPQTSGCRTSVSADASIYHSRVSLKRCLCSVSHALRGRIKQLDVLTSYTGDWALLPVDGRGVLNLGFLGPELEYRFLTEVIISRKSWVFSHRLMQFTSRMPEVEQESRSWWLREGGPSVEMHLEGKPRISKNSSGRLG